MSELIKVREFISRDIDLEVYDDVCEELCISFVGPITLTEEGANKFKDILDLELQVYEDYALLLLNYMDDWEGLLKLAKTFFESAAGYCSSSDWDKWFQS